MGPLKIAIARTADICICTGIASKQESFGNTDLSKAKNKRNVQRFNDRVCPFW